MKMTEEDIQSMLDRGLRLGVVKPMDTAEYLGWILVSKHSPDPRRNALLDGIEDASAFAEQQEREVAPYLILNIELKRSVHESGDYETEKDYRMKTKTWCRDLEHVRHVLDGLGFGLNDLRQSNQLDAP
jgi:hypothetical protein